ncbi:MAG: hypothetical protein SGJ20_18145 [Planctomycetota bacterium]|nr:hypothetical protein [Planctomycetota bacterium]
MFDASFLIAEAGTRTRYEWTRLLTYTEWWQKPLLVLVCLLVVAYVIYMYRRDSVELKRGVGVLLAILRLAAFAGLLLNYLDLQKRTDVLSVQNSQVAVMIDVSTSMGQPPGETVLSGSASSRMDQVTDALTKTDLIRRLRQKHDITFYRFDEQLVRVATFARLQPNADEKQANQPTQIAGGAVSEDAAKNDKSKDENAGKASPSGDPDGDASAVKPIDWKTVLVAKGTESRYGQNLRQLVNDLRNAPLAGLVIVGDFAQNAGIDVNAAIQLASEAQIPVHTIGLGSDRVAVNAAIVDFKVPARAYPGDKFQIEALVQGKELAGRNVTVELVSRLGSDQANNAQETLDAREVVLLGDNRDMRPLKFELPGITQPGRRTYTLRLKGINQDSNPTDDQISADLEIVERKNTVLLFSGGPTREYQFLRNQLKRDKDTEVDVYLQNAPEGISQDARAVLTSFPKTMKELAEYDTIVAFDPDWRELRTEQIQLLDDWLFKESGGLVVIAGPIYMEHWIQSKDLAKIRSIYPVEFHTRLLALDDSKFGSTTPWPIEFSREGLDAEFLWLGSGAEESLRNWSDFPGVFGFYQVKGAKPGAVVYGRYSDPEAGLSDGKPVFLAEQFWGSGRVFYIGSGEFWRLREQSVGFV